MNSQLLLGIWERICRVRYFEEGIRLALTDGVAAPPSFLSTGNEVVPAAMSYAIPEFTTFFRRGCHAASLSWGDDPTALRDGLLERPERDEWISTPGGRGFLTENVPIAVGEALGSGRKTVCFFAAGGAADEDRVLSAMGVAATHRLPVLFVREDHDAETAPAPAQRGWSLAQAARTLGMTARVIVDDPWTIHARALEVKGGLPAFINTCCGHRRAGDKGKGPSGCDGFAVIRDRLGHIGFQRDVERIEEEAKKEMAEVWDLRGLWRNG
ncbi:MAG: hypothetical protein Q8P48_05235 [Deltaproteobacteria bacterium]|nr:hypothetical protein [Deltaproteobacteria bacterium]